jgi:ornithine cyclodeaminase/alanine dehydrogenase
MAKVEFTYLSEEDIRELGLKMAQVIDLVEQGLAEHGRGGVENPPKPGIHSSHKTFIHAMPAYYKNLNIGGLKWVSGYPDNRALGLPATMGIVVLNDMKTGAPLCIMDGTWITAIRTAAVSAVTAKYCARNDSKVLGIVGAGVQGRYNLIAIKEVLPDISTVKIMDINRGAAEKYRDELSLKTSTEVIVCNDVECVAKGSDIILTATERLSAPLIKNEWFEEGCLGLGLEASRAWYGDTILSADRFITDDWNQTTYYHSQGAFPDGLPEKYTELGSIIIGENKGRERDEDRILAINIGLALEDIIVADQIYKMAKEKEKYSRLTLMER